jgi:hypothetical protein
VHDAYVGADAADNQLVGLDFLEGGFQGGFKKAGVALFGDGGAGGEIIQLRDNLGLGGAMTQCGGKTSTPVVRAVTVGEEKYGRAFSALLGQQLFDVGMTARRLAAV